LEEQPEQAAVDGGAGMGPNSFSRAKPRLIKKPSMPAGALSCRAKGAPVLSKPMGNTKAADSKPNGSIACMTSLFPSLHCVRHTVFLASWWVEGRWGPHRGGSA